jgi:hypothetical protein
MNCRRCSSSERTAPVWLIACFLPLLLTGGGAASSEPLSAEVVVQRLVAANARRARELRGYRGKRSYHVEYQGFLGSREAQMQVEATYIAPDKKDFKIISQAGSTLLLKRVVMKLLENEKEAQRGQNLQEMELSPRNYDFAMLERQRIPEGDFYVLEVTPKAKNKFLYRGKIWVDSGDFAVARIQGEPAKNPSFWISHTQIEHRYAKVGDFWLPRHNQSVTQIRLGGKAVLTIDYTDYQIMATVPQPSKTSAPSNSIAVPK